MKKNQSRCIIYIRTKHKAQLAELQSIARNQGLSVVEVMEESDRIDGTSHPLLMQALQSIKQGETDSLLLARLPRNAAARSMVSRALKDGSLKEVRLPGNIRVTNSSDGLMIASGLVANQYRADLRKSIRRGQDDKAARGWYPLRPPVGYRTNSKT